MQLLCAHEIDYLITQKKSIPFEYVHWHWHFVCCLVWDFRQNKSPERPNANLSPQQVGSRQTRNLLIPRSPTQEDNSREPTPTPRTLSNGEDIDSDFESQSHEPPAQIREQHAPILCLKPRLQTIEDLITVKPRGQPSGSLNKKQSQRDIAFERSTCRDPSLFEHREREFSASQQQGIPRSGILGKAVQRTQNRLRTRTNPPRSGNVSGVLTDMTSVFSI